MLILHCSNKTENLLIQAAEVFKFNTKNQQAKNVFAKEVFLIQHKGMSVWISQQFATHFNLCANFSLIFISGSSPPAGIYMLCSSKSGNLTDIWRQSSLPTRECMSVRLNGFFDKIQTPL